MKKHWSTTLVIAGGLLTAASVLQAQGSPPRYANDTKIPISKEPLMPVKGTVTRVDVDGTNENRMMPAPVRAFRIEDYSNLSQAQLAYYLATRDSLLIAIDRIALNKVVDPTVRNFAATQEQERTKHLAAVEHQVTAKGVGTEPIPNDYAQDRLRELVAQFDTMSSGPAFDAAYMKVQYYEHQNEGQVLVVNKPNVHVEDFEDVVEDSIEGFAKVRDQTYAILTALGVTLP